ncbi:hypothetical protein HJFPF1_10934 [Paramyrothecium foliicola]|nr:hypothetical protein HJFPF1_10934 [Paramyrothecium foliicola]
MDDINVSTYDLAPLCSLCGGSFGRAWVAGSAADREHRDWSRFARGIRGDKSIGQPSARSLTGLCILNGGRFLVPFPNGLVPMLPRQYELSVRTRDDSTYGVHELCWKLLLRRIAAIYGSAPSPEWCAQWLYWVLAALPYSPRGGLITHNGYFGAVNERKRSIIRLDIGVDYPRQGQPFKDLKHTDPTLPSENTIQWLNSSQDPFRKLPYEILCCIFPLLSPGDICHIRLASRWIALHTAPSLLPPSFWKKRFAHDGEMGFIDMTEAPKSTIDCFRLYRHYRRLLNASPGDKGLQNRRRIWHCLEPFAKTLAAILGSEEVAWPWGSADTQSAGNEGTGQKISCYGFPEIDGLLQFGAKTYQVKSLNFEHLMNGATIQISHIPFEGRTYVCGLRLSDPDMPSHNAQKVGLLNSRNSSTIRIRPNSSIVKIDVFVSLDGINGFVFFVRDVEGQLTAMAAGETSPQGCYTAVASLEPEGDLKGLVLKFDWFKALSIQLIDSSSTPSAIEPQLWSAMHRPSDEIAKAMKLPPVTNTMSLCHFVSFGGENGERLASLIRLAVFMDGAAGFYGISFYYNDGSEVLYGSKTTTHQLGQTVPCVEQSFLIHGPDGERIIGLEYLTAESPHIGYDCMIGLKGYDRKGFEDIQRTTVKIPHGHYPTSLVLQLAAPLWCFRRVYLGSSKSLPQMRAPETAVIRNIAVTEHDTDLAAWMTRKTGSSISAASLSGVRRIRVSIGRLGRSCSNKHISGLWLEYFEKQNDVIVGQWMDEIGSFVLEPDESLVGLVISGTESTKPPGASAWYEAQLAWKGIQVTGLRFRTSLGRKHDFHQTLKGDEGGKAASIAYSATPYEELQTIIWASNVVADDVQVRFKPSPLLGSGYLLLCDAIYNIRHPCLSTRTTRCFLNYDNSDPEPMNPLNKSCVYGAMRRYYHSSEIFLWQERSPTNGKLVRLTKVEIVYDPTTDGVRGFRCAYGGEFTKEFGLLTGNTYTLELKHTEERISLLVARRITDGNYGIELHTTAGQVCRAMPENREDYEVESYAMASGAKPPKILGETQWKKTHWSFPDSNPTGQAVIDSVGIWVSGPRSTKTDAAGSQISLLDSFGPVYATSSKAKVSKSNLGLSLKERIHNATHGGGWTFK